MLVYVKRVNLKEKTQKIEGVYDNPQDCEKKLAELYENECKLDETSDVFILDTKFEPIDYDIVIKQAQELASKGENFGVFEYDDKS